MNILYDKTVIDATNFTINIRWINIVKLVHLLLYFISYSINIKLKFNFIN